MATKIPAFTYTGESSAEVKDGYWYIYLKSSGTLKLSYAKTADAFLVGGGGGGGWSGAPSYEWGAGGGGGGYCTTASDLAISANAAYEVTIGEGGARAATYNGAGSAGGTTSAFGKTAEGGSGGLGSRTGGSGTGAGGNGGNTTGVEGSEGGDGVYAFGDESLLCVGGGGGGGSGRWAYGRVSGGAGGGGNGAQGAGQAAGRQPATAGTANTGGGGGGGGGGYYDHDFDDHRFNTVGGEAADGGSGVVILRGTQDDFLPVKFDGVQLSKILFNGEEVTGLVFGGTRIFARMLRRMRRAFEGRDCAYGV